MLLTGIVCLLRIGEALPVKWSFCSQFAYFIYCFSLFLHSRYLVIAKQVSLPKTENHMISSTSNLCSHYLCLLLYPLYVILPKSYQPLHIQVNPSHIHHLLFSLMASPDYSHVTAPNESFPKHLQCTQVNYRGEWFVITVQRELQVLECVCAALALFWQLRVWNLASRI